MGVLGSRGVEVPCFVHKLARVAVAEAVAEAVAMAVGGECSMLRRLLC